MRRLGRAGSIPDGRRPLLCALGVHHLGRPVRHGGDVAQPVKVRQLSNEERRILQRLVRRGEGQRKTSIVRYRRALVILASADGNPVLVIAQLVQSSPDRVRERIHNFNNWGLLCLDPKWAGGRPRRITSSDEAFIVETARTQPEELGQPFTQWSIRKLAQFLEDNPNRRIGVGRERLRQILISHQITFERTTRAGSLDSAHNVKLDRI